MKKETKLEAIDRIYGNDFVYNPNTIKILEEKYPALCNFLGYSEQDHFVDTNKMVKTQYQKN